MKPLHLVDIENSQTYDFNIIKDDNKKDVFKIKYKNNNIIIDLDTIFEKCYISKQFNASNIKITLNKHDNILETFRILYDNICYSVEKNDDINVFDIVNPIKKYNVNILFVNISPKTIIKNIENDKIIALNEIENKTFDMYPILYLDNLTMSNDKLYINFSFNSIFIKVVNNDVHNIEINYEKIKNLMINNK